jgi:primosomal protein N' (replication factor Y)
MEHLVNVVIPPLKEAYTYRLQEACLAVDVGYQVEVSLGRRSASGFVISRYQDEITPERFPYALKQISDEVTPLRAFSPEQLKFFNWVSEYYGEPLASVIDVAIPGSVEPKLRREIKVINTNLEGLRGAKERQVLSAAIESPSFEVLQRRVKNPLPVLRKLSQKGFIELIESESLELPFASAPTADWAKISVELNTKQSEAVSAIVEAIERREFKPFLLHGVTGSGKTEVYLEAIRSALAAGYGAMMVVPEIALTPQLIDRFRARLGNDLAVLHSGLSKRHRWNSWRSLLEGTTRVAIGARSGIFAPVPNLGLIIVDEEHDSSYKQNEGLRYHARDLAVVLAKLHSCPVVLGSATPSLESYHHATETKRYTYLSLPGRHGATHGEISVVDMNRERPWTLASKHVSQLLASALESILVKKEQAFVLYNRRGFASYVQCESCEHVIECENCSVTMTYHRADHSLLCHYCSLSKAVPTFCPVCSSNSSAETDTSRGTLTERGAGTEQIFEEIKTLFPSARIERLDRDSASDHESYKAILDRLRKHEIDILVGTQMIAKGHDLPNVTLVGVADCDVGLHLPDFRASERVFQLLTQAAGRAGRGDKPGSVVLQTRVPRHPSLVKTAQNNFKDFAELELRNRKVTLFPPYSRLLRIVLSSQERELPMSTLGRFREHLEKLKAAQRMEFQILGPAPTPIRKIKTLWRAHMLIKSHSASIINRVLNELSSIELRSNKIRVVFDVDPQEML